jgi:hypothetical protein
LEDPLLIDPTCVNPSDHINWKVVADHPLAVPMSSYGEKSIDIFGLNRSKLAEARRELQLRLEEDFLLLKQMIITISEDPSDESVRRWLPILDQFIENFLKNGDENNEFSAFARHIVDSRYETIAGMVRSLLARVTA